MKKIIKVKVSAGAKTENIQEIATNVFRVRVQAPPEKGKANARATKLLSEYFGIPIVNVTLVGGATFKEKIFSIEI
jgi:uncharacterized protein (TIGR00251 family)